jgi:hypothetical protein
VSNCTGVLNGPAGSAAMLTWYQGNFTGVLNRLAGSEAMSGKGEMSNTHWIPLARNTSNGPGSYLKTI